MNAARTNRKTSPQSLASPGAAEETDDRFPIVGIGASAGGLSAFEAFFSGMPADSDPGMAFVLVQHLAPDHKSILADLIRRYTRMQVFEVKDGMPVQVNCAYIIPPNHDMAFLNGTLQLLEPSEPRGRRLPIDFFFRSLAQDLHQRAIGIVLSGTGSDGTLGVRAIKGEAGMVMAQSPETTEFDGMPRSAIATGLVDWELPPAAMPAQLIAYVAHAFGTPSVLLNAQVPTNENALKKIFILLRAQTGHDLSQYKPSTINRRIWRRMAVHQIDSIDAYVRYLQKTPYEVDALFRDLLIGVTSFFRDPHAFQILEEQVIPQIFDNHPPGSVIRVWSTGCSTGEEAYSIAILLQERMEALLQGWTLQVFASDIDRHAIAAARAAVYPASIAADLSPQRLARFFTADADGNNYRVNKSIRDLLVFSEQDLLRDPPFSRLDLISCRNLLIYLGADLQKSLVPLFHYALNPYGILFLGTSESVGGYLDLFSVLDRQAKIYQRRDDFAGKQFAAMRRFLPPPTANPRNSAKAALPAKRPLREVAEQALLEQIGVAAALVNGQGDIFYLHGRTGSYLEPAPGEAGINNILRMAREGLQVELGMALAKAATSHQVVRVSGLRVKTNDHFSWVRLSVGPVTGGTGVTPASPPYLVTFEGTPALDPEATDLPVAGVADTEVDPDARIAALTVELRAKDEYLQSTREELETANEELKSSNEEMQSVNEELQSTNEELETSKEELQSVNEELATVNAELNTKVLDLSRANNDMNNLLAGTGIATVFVDHCLRILRFTPSASQIINLIPSDVGRAVGHIVSNLVGYDRLVDDVQDVLDTLAFKEAQVRSTAGRWYTMNIRPYRTLDNVIEGAVITFFDITEMRRNEGALAKEQQSLRLAVVVRDAFDAITVHDLEGRIIAWNPAAVRIYGWSEAEALQLNVRDRIPPPLRDDAKLLLRELGQEKISEPYHTPRLTRSGAVLDVLVTTTALLDASGQIYAMATTERVCDAQAFASGGK
ncbi:chemotaxis protein CheB [Accumulibacter sp.]|uniref:chemotaxis protein CheB n=1 Tax=Accumulibacter sp. TaxID=2053492 RepID=UPI002C8D300F|nr:chemotaxis protein CheB [Accumulibacter sp.]HPU80999.1 chemotaxis protein CheB [Accumulibacter sp.]